MDHRHRRARLFCYLLQNARCVGSRLVGNGIDHECPLASPVDRLVEHQVLIQPLLGLLLTLLRVPPQAPAQSRHVWLLTRPHPHSVIDLHISDMTSAHVLDRPIVEELKTTLVVAQQAVVGFRVAREVLDVVDLSVRLVASGVGVLVLLSCQ